MQSFTMRGKLARCLVLCAVLASSACGGGGGGGSGGAAADAGAAPSAPVAPSPGSSVTPGASPTVTVFAGVEQAAGSAETVGAGNADGQGAAARFKFPEGLASLPDGGVLVADGGNGVLRQISSSGAVSTLAATFPGFPNGAGFASGQASYVAVDDQGTTYVTGQNLLQTNAIYAISPGGQVRVHARVQGATTSLATGPGGRLYVGDQGNIIVVNPDGSRNTPITGTSCSESAIAVNGPVLYLACPGAHTVRSVDAQGRSVVIAGQQSTPGKVDGGLGVSRLDTPSAVAVDPAGNLYIADASTIRRVAADGVVHTIATTSTSAAPLRVKALTWSRGMLYATVPHAVLRIGPVN